MDLQEFAESFNEGIDLAVEMSGNDYDEELISSILEYVVDTGEVTAPELCVFKKPSLALSAYDYNEETNSLDLFLLVKTDTKLGKINDTKVLSAFNNMSNLYEQVVQDRLTKGLENPNDVIFEVNALVKSSIGKISLIREFVLTNGLSEFEPKSFERPDGIIVEQNVWDMQRIYQQDRIRSGKEKITIDFPVSYNTELQCLRLPKGNQDVDAYLAIIPGITLAQIYKKYQQSLLEKNVRTFLQFKAKVNRGIRETLLSEPDMFFSYNNGISTTATGVTVKEKDGLYYITNIANWQIVNGGQTTASIASIFSEKGTDISKVFVPMKLSVIEDEEKSKVIVPKISNFANSQTAIKDSDFSANDPYLAQIENFSRSIWVPNGNSKSVCKWYFERTRGQYLDELAQLRGFNERQFRTNYPKNQKFTKTDLAKYEMCWMQQPYVVCRGAEKNYKDFVKEIKATSPTVTEIYYKRLVAKAILYAKLDKYVRNKNLGGYKSNMVNYLLASLAFVSKRALDLDYIWEHQDIQDSLYALLDMVTKKLWDHLTNNQNAKKADPGEWSKMPDCWNDFKISLSAFAALPESLLLSPQAMVDETLTPLQLQKIEEAWAYSEDVWFGLSQWAKQHNMFTPLDRKMLYGYGASKSRGKNFTLKQAVKALALIEEAIKQGFDPKQV